MTRAIAVGILATAIVGFLIVNVVAPAGSHPASKSFQAEHQIKMLLNWASSHKEKLPTTRLDNAVFTAATAGSIGSDLWKYNNKGELLDPWDEPYIISQVNGEISIRSSGLERHNRLSSLQRWLSDE